MLVSAKNSIRREKFRVRLVSLWKKKVESAIGLPFLFMLQMGMLQHIGKIDGIEKVGISYYDICNFGRIQIISYMTFL